MDFFDLVNKRRSVRKFSDEKVPEEVIDKSLKAALLAANSSNLNRIITNDRINFYHIFTN